MEIADFLRARFADDERVANLSVSHGTGGFPVAWWQQLFNGPGQQPSMHAKRLLAECDAKRRIVEAELLREVGPVSHYVSPDVHAAIAGRTVTPVLRLLALPYADHPDYREEWKP